MFTKAKNSSAALFLASLAASAAGSPDPTPAPAMVTSAPAASSSSRVTTSFYSFVTTEIPRDEHSIGMGLQREGTDEYCTYMIPPQLVASNAHTADWLYCINEPFTTKSGFAGCGEDDLYTACSGRVATGIDGGEILWYVQPVLPPSAKSLPGDGRLTSISDQQCVTHKVFADLDVTTFTPFIGCGRGTSTMLLVRTSTGTGSPVTGSPTPTEDEESLSSTTASSTADSAGHGLRCNVLSVVGLVAALCFCI